MTTEQVPTLDVRDARSAERAPFVRELGAAFQRYGFATITGHPVTRELTEPLYDAMKRFFALPEEVKRKYVVAGSGGARGFTPFRIETAKDQSDPDLKEFWHVGRELPRDNSYGLPANLWPSEVPELKQHALALWSALESLGAELLTCVAEHLGLPAQWFADKIDHGNSILRPLHYPPLQPGVRGVRSAAHEDINLITLLVGSHEPGLEILTRAGQWLPVEAGSDQIVVNVGDMLQRLTNHVLVSTTHRVVNPADSAGQRARFSIPYFLHFNPEFVIETLPSCVSSDRPTRYPQAISADDYLKQRLREIGLL